MSHVEDEGFRGNVLAWPEEALEDYIFRQILFRGQQKGVLKRPSGRESAATPTFLNFAARPAQDQEIENG